MEILINILLVSSPYLGAMFFGVLFYLFYGRKFLKAKSLGGYLTLVLFFMIMVLVTSPLIRPTTTYAIDQSIVHQLEQEAEQVIDVEDLVLEDKTPEVKVKSEYKKYEPSL